MKLVRSALAAAAAAVVFAGAAAAGATLVTGGTVTPNSGAAGITLGMTRAQVIAKLGKPVYQNLNGYMQYGRESRNILFDVYLDTSVHPWRVRMLGISGRNFCLAGGGPCLRRVGGTGKLRSRYGKALHAVTLDDGEKVVWLKGSLKGCKVFTDFGSAGLPAKTPIVMVFVGYQSGRYC